MTRLLVSRAVFDGAVRLAVAAGMDPDRAVNAASLLYRLAVQGAAGPSVAAGVGDLPPVAADTPKERTEEEDAA